MAGNAAHGILPEMPAAKERPDLRARLHEVPHKPGVYLMRDRLHRVIYVGKARDLRKRLAQYFTPARSRLADLKTRALLDSVWDFTLHVVRSDAEAVLLEGRLIKEYREIVKVQLGRSGTQPEVPGNCRVDRE